eukprot:CAMPEP_0201660688 /NCGR_PEP_ID=MMETSP0494-20130426/3278_1 /ASSEMBLY_ACC=CAM_ASM_000839 /TAXON_ID=420259 /ORGANISM="Thalassiosira gravida, Strain GMp14c1" /LENGTH=522 /DNA_ID=CAMNT_0048138635 /DNA_START=78 /DNA_END=1649 /DNA_ORIENTATION=-
MLDRNNVVESVAADVASIDSLSVERSINQINWDTNHQFSFTPVLHAGIENDGILTEMSNPDDTTTAKPFPDDIFGTVCTAGGGKTPDVTAEDMAHSPSERNFSADDNKTNEDGTEVVPPSGSSSSNPPNIYPEWSWDHVRTYVSIRHSHRYSKAQIRALAAQDIVMLEKYNGPKTYGSTEEGTFQAAKRIKAVNPNVKILFYLNAMVHYSGKSYAANKTWKDEWAMFDPKKKSIFKWREKHPCYDHRNLEFREWWIQRALDKVAHDEIDGVFIDGIVKTDKRFLPVKNHGEAYLATANELRERLPAGKILIGNGLRANTSNKNGYLEHLEYLDGSYLENWTRQKNLAPTLKLMSAALKKGRIIMLNGEPRNVNKTEYDQMRNLDDRYDYLGKPEIIGFSLGYFLLVAEPHAHLSYHSGVDAHPRMMAVFDNTRFEAITRKLGKPLGDYVKNGNEYTREFEYLKVWVNLETTQAVLTVKDGQDTLPSMPSASVGQSSKSPSSSDSETSQSNGKGTPRGILDEL